MKTSVEAEEGGSKLAAGEEEGTKRTGEKIPPEKAWRSPS